MLSVSQIKQLCEHYRFNPSKSRGQNFLLHDKAIHAMVDALQIKRTDTVIEIGPGFGALTQELVKHAKKVIALELEQVCVDYMQEHLPSVHVVKGDAMRTLPRAVEALPGRASYVLVGNIPYNITGALLEQAFTLAKKPRAISFMVQREVGERVCALPPRMNFLSALTRSYSTPRVVARVPKGHFWPAPKVDSVVVHCAMHAISSQPREEQAYLKILRSGFQHPRKTLLNNLLPLASGGREQVQICLAQAGLKPTVRPAELSVEKWHTVCLCIV